MPRQLEEIYRGHWPQRHTNWDTDNWTLLTTGTLWQLGHWQLRHRQLGHSRQTGRLAIETTDNWGTRVKALTFLTTGTLYQLGHHGQQAKNFEINISNKNTLVLFNR